MGNFNVSCGISHLTINENEEVYILPLLKKETSDKNSYFLETNDCYTPFCFPIKGLYNGYGGIYDIEKNENTKKIEQYLNKSIESFIKEICDNYLDSNNDISSKISVMYIKKEVYCFMIKNLDKDDEKKLFESIQPDFFDTSINFAENYINKTLEDLENLNDSFYNRIIKLLFLNLDLDFFDQFEKIYFNDKNNLSLFKKELSDLFYLNYNMYAINCIYSPSLKGHQLGKPKAELNFYKNIYKICKK